MINGVLHRPAGCARYNVQMQELTRFFDIKSARNAFSAFDTNVSFIIKIIYFKCFTSANLGCDCFIICRLQIFNFFSSRNVKMVSMFC